MNGYVTQYVLIFERALEGVYAIGPFDKEDEAKSYAQKNHSFPQIWRVAELKRPERQQS